MGALPQATIVPTHLGAPVPPKAYRQQPMLAKIPPPAYQQPEMVGETPRYVGTIKSFFPEKRFGFIACEEMQAQHGGDVFLSDQEVQSFSVGDIVSFTVDY